MLRFVIESYSFKRILFITVIFIVLFFTTSKVFDYFWDSSASIPIINLNDVYDPPLEYDNFTRINMKLINPGHLAIEGNKMFRVKDRKNKYDYYDTISIFYPDTTFEKYNKIFLEFEDSKGIDSVYIVTAKSEDDKIYYKQIFYSSVIVNQLNEFSDSPEKFRIKNETLVSPEILKNNDTLISQVFEYFNQNINNLGLAECGTNSRIFNEICMKFQVPCRIINLQGGDADQTGYYQYLGYPLHVLCEIYSSKEKKWYVVDPSFGFRFKNQGDSTFLNAAEICNRHTFRNVDYITQEPVLFTNRTLMGKDYFKYYENVIFTRPEWKNTLFRKVVSVFYFKFNYFHLLYSNNFPPVKNGFYYFGLKTFIYFFLLLLYINLIMILFIKRLFLVKKPE